ncbi:sigma-54-dependent transcriptional regulator [Flavobacterium pectinovorum]|uniref:Sigma-54-dependent Fis family transcriptional regulator n=1 Tax=Flavobacterium pectinovorum TaxID=29533 RepID=A0A502EL99_9FLAO|nr:sigma-54 dependent transcriptional regulator [Flavobacterium pectinovorum]TPG38515.1 sigma-54-dependent Fis family transcriptional regulator [Flavobacterium pectinovorum]
MNSKRENILIVDDNYDMLDLIQRHLKSFNYRSYKASSVSEAIDVLKYTAIDLLITDLNMPEVNGVELLKYTDEHFPSIPKLVVSGLPSFDNAITALKSGALDYLIKPFTSEELYKAIKYSFTKSDLNLKNSTKASPEVENNFSGIVGLSNHYQNLVETIKRVTNNKVNVLIEGESGTGKELIAKAIHFNGPLKNMPFISVNCGGFPESLVESELFGYTKGAFTGASESKIGLFQAASGGTLFLDEIGNASMAVQTRLLRVLQEKEITRVGATNPEKVNARIITATNNDLYQMVLNGTFREDLYYRINVVNIKTTPLREKKDDIPLLVSSFIKKYATEYNKPDVAINPKVIEILLRYSWPGNVRELENIIQRMIVMSDDNIDIQSIPDHLKYHIHQKSEIFKSLKEYEKEQITKVLTAVGNNKSKAAKILQIDRKTLNQKII